jgi:hypothetical protein
VALKRFIACCLRSRKGIEKQLKAPNNSVYLIGRLKHFIVNLSGTKLHIR